MLSCTKCWSDLPAWAVAQGGTMAACPDCGSTLELHLFPAFAQSTPTLTPEQLQLTEEAASCFHHASKRAEACCSRCGKFLCALCALDIGSETWCAACLSGDRDPQIAQLLTNRRTLWDSIALGTALLPLCIFVLFYFWIFTAPAAIFLSVRNWSRPGSLLPRTKVRFIIAILIALAELTLLALFAFVMYQGWHMLHAVPAAGR